MSPSIEEPRVTAADTDIEKVGPATTTTDTPEAKDEEESDREEEEEEVYPPWNRVAIIMTAVYCTMFIVALVSG